MIANIKRNATHIIILINAQIYIYINVQVGTTYYLVKV